LETFSRSRPPARPRGRRSGKAQGAKERLLKAVLDATCEETAVEREGILSPSRSRSLVPAIPEATYVLDQVGFERAAIADEFGRPIGPCTSP